jgi:GNAT superfamily N-acetyltransferase
VSGEPGPATGEAMPRGMQTPDIRPATPDELDACASIWFVATNDYLVRLNQPEIPVDQVGITALLRHTQATDPERFLVAVRSDATAETPTDAPDGERIVAFISAVERGSLWFLSMLFVLPEEQATGIGGLLLERVLPDPARGMTLGTATDSAQAVSNALYSRYGIVPRMPLLDLSGGLRRPEALPDLPDGVTVTAFEEVVAEAAGVDGSGHRELAAIVNGLDRATLGVEHPQDHAYLRTAGRHGYVYRSAGGGRGSGAPRASDRAPAPDDPASRRLRRLDAG